MYINALQIPQMYITQIVTPTEGWNHQGLIEVSQCVSQKHSLSMAIKRQKKCGQYSPSDGIKFKYKFNMRKSSIHSHHKMHQFVPLYNQRNSTILGSAAIGIHFNSVIFENEFWSLYNDKINGHILTQYIAHITNITTSHITVGMTQLTAYRPLYDIFEDAMNGSPM